MKYTKSNAGAGRGVLNCDGKCISSTAAERPKQNNPLLCPGDFSLSLSSFPKSLNSRNGSEQQWHSSTPHPPAPNAQPWVLGHGLLPPFCALTPVPALQMIPKHLDD